LFGDAALHEMSTVKVAQLRRRLGTATVAAFVVIVLNSILVIAKN
jgi:hypothetical protein